MEEIKYHGDMYKDTYFEGRGCKILKFKEMDRGLLKMWAVIVGSEVVIFGAFIIILIKMLSSNLWC